MTWGIIGALDAEVAHIRQKMDIRKTVTAYGADFSCGTIGNAEVIAVCSSIGTINAAACTSLLVREFQADAVINVGIAGAMGKGLAIMDVVISEDVIFHDKDHSILEKYYPFKRRYQADPKLIECCVSAIRQLNRPLRYHVGRVASGDIFVSDPAVKERILSQYQPLCVEMEGAAVGQIATMGNIPFLVIRTMSDNADSSASQSYDNFLEAAAAQSSDIVLSMLQNCKCK